MISKMVKNTHGFTLIEILIALVIVSVGVLALGGFGITTLNSGQVSRERLTAIHLAEQVLEYWQQDANDRLPEVATDCVLTDAAGVVSYPATNSCTPAAGGVGIEYTIAADIVRAIGPLPSDLNSMQNFSQPTGYTNTPEVKLVTVSWSHKGENRSVYLTHVSEVK